MTTKILSGNYAGGYAMVLPTTVVSITTTGYVGGNGVTSPGSKTGAYTVVNEGTVKGATTTFGVYLYSGGLVTNGAATLTTNQISGGIGVVVGEKSGTVVNFATIQGTGIASGGAEGNGVVLSQGGVVTNGTAADKSALIAGGTAVAIYGQAGTIGNFGTLTGTASPPNGRAIVYLGAGGSLTNGASNDTAAFIGGTGGPFFDPVDAKRAAASVTNFGAIIGAQAGIYDSSTGELAIYLSTAINLEAGGRVTNGTAADTNAYIYGTYGIVIGGARGTVVNNGSIVSHFYDYRYVPPTDYQGGYTNTYLFGVGVSLKAGGIVDNGSAANTKASIYAAEFGVAVSGAAGTVNNFATIQSTGGAFSAAVSLGAGGNVTNGGPTDHAALITGNNVGVELVGAGVVTNFGTISAAAAVVFASSAARLVVEAGALFQGYVGGGGGTLELACGTGAIAEITPGIPGDVSGYVWVHGVLPSERFFDFGTLEIAAGTDITLDGGGVTDAKAGDIAEMDLVGELIVTGSLTTGGKVIGAGTLSLAAGQTTFGTATSLTVSHVTVTGGEAIAAANLTYAGDWDQTGGTVSVETGEKLTFDGVGDSFTGTLTGVGSLIFSKGADTFSTLTLSNAHQSISGASVTLSGAIDLGATLTVTTPNLIVAAAGATLTGGGTLLMSNNATNEVRGVSATARLTNFSDRILGAGQLGGGEMMLVNDAGGTIEGDYAIGLTLDTGSRGITNGGLIEAVGAGLVTIKSALINNGTLLSSGDLVLDAAVSGTGKVRILGGTADFTSTFTQSVSFTTSGVLELAHSQAYTGTISGFSKGAATSLDMGDIAFAAGTTKASYSGTTASGVLTVTDGTHTSKIALAGNYIAGGFTVASDGHGGTTVTDKAGGTAASPTPLVSAMAGFGGDSGSSTVPLAWRSPPPDMGMIVRPA